MQRYRDRKIKEKAYNCKP